VKIKIKENKQKTGEESVGNRQKKKPPAMEAEFLQPKRISRPSSKQAELFTFLSISGVTKELVAQTVPNL
jgi:hypothetical protein